MHTLTYILGAHTKPYFSLSLSCACLVLFVLSLLNGCTVSSYGLPPSTVSMRSQSSRATLTRSKSSRPSVFASHFSFSRLISRAQNGYLPQSQTALVGAAEDFLSCSGKLDLPKRERSQLNVISFLSVAWTMTDYDGTTQ